MLVSFRWATVALAFVMVVLVHESVAAPVMPGPTPAPPSSDIELDELLTGITWDDALSNEFEWIFADPQISTACDDVRAPFPAKVAAMGCIVKRVGDRRRSLARTSAFFGDVPGGRPGVGLPSIVEGPVSDTGRPLPTVPLPGGVVLLATALGGLAIARTSRTSRLAKRSGAA